MANVNFIPFRGKKTLNQKEKNIERNLKDFSRNADLPEYD